MPRYQRSIPPQGQAPAAAPSAGPMGGMMASQQPGMRHPIPSIYTSVLKIRKNLYFELLQVRDRTKEFCPTCLPPVIISFVGCLYLNLVFY